MNEGDLIKAIINKTGSSFIGDDCAYLKDLNITVTQDSLVEDIHFKRDWCTPFQLGYKSVAVNISDILASGAIPKYITIALSLPKNIDDNFISEFYDGANSCKYDVEIVGGDITGSTEKIMVSVTAIGLAFNRNISSRKNAQPDYIIITKGMHGTSAAGLNELIKGGTNDILIKAHLEPELEYNFSNKIATTVKESYAMMDSSDGLCDALFKIAESSNVKIIADYEKIPHLDCVTEEQVLFGGEDYKLIAAIPEKYLNQIDGAVKIGKVVPYNGERLNISGRIFNNYNELSVFNHFGE